MARRRYISTRTSTDKEFNQLAMQYGDFAGMLYLLMIPHCEDDASMTGDPDELLATVAPMRRDRTPEDVIAALMGMVSLGLITWDRAGKVIYFPTSFYNYQTYIGSEKRRGAGNGGDSAQSPQNTEQQRETPQNAPSPSPSPSVSVKQQQLPSAREAPRPPKKAAERSAPPPAAAAADAHATEFPEKPPDTPSPGGNLLLPRVGENPCRYVRRVLPALPKHWPPELDSRYRKAATGGSVIRSEWAWKQKIIVDWLTGAEPPPEAPRQVRVRVAEDPPPLPRGNPLDPAILSAKFAMPGNGPHPPGNRSGLQPPPVLDRKAQEEARQREQEQAAAWLAALTDAQRATLTAEVEAEADALEIPPGRLRDKTIASRIEARAIAVVREKEAD